LSGRVGRFILRSGFDGTTVADFNATDCYGNGYRHSGGYQWTLGLPKIYDRSGNNVAPATFGSGSNQPQWLPWEGRSQVRFPETAGNYADIGVSGIGSGQFTVVLDGWSDNWNDASATHRYIAYARNDESQIAFITIGGVLRVYGSGTSIVSAGHPASGRVQWRLQKTDSTTASIAWRTDGITSPTASGWTTSASGTVDVGSTGGATRIGDHAGTPRFTCYGCAAYNSSGTKVWEFAPALCGQSGYTDPVSGQAWSITRASAGRKVVVQSPAARSARSVIQHATDDWIDVPAAAVPVLDTFAAASSVTATFRRWHNPGASGHAIFATKASLADQLLGLSIRLSTTAASTDIRYRVGDATTADGPSDVAVALGVRAVSTTGVGDSTPFITGQINDSAMTGDTNRNTTVSTSTGGAGRIGAYTGGTGAIDMEFEALVTRDAGTSDLEHDRLVRYYRGGV